MMPKTLLALLLLTLVGLQGSACGKDEGAAPAKSSEKKSAQKSQEPPAKAEAKKTGDEAKPTESPAPAADDEAPKVLTPEETVRKYISIGGSGDLAALKPLIDPACHQDKDVARVGATLMLGARMTVKDLAVKVIEAGADRATVAVRVTGSVSAKETRTETDILGSKMELSVSGLEISSATQITGLVLVKKDGRWVVGCGEPVAVPDGAFPEADDGGDEAAAASGSDEPEALEAAPFRPGPVAYLVAEDDDVVRLADGKFEPVGKVRSPKQAVVGPDGRLYVRSFFGDIYSYGPKGLTSLGEPAGGSEVLLVGPVGKVVWVVNNDGLQQWAGTEWKSEPGTPAWKRPASASFSADEKTLAVAEDDAIHLRQDGAWTKVPLDKTLRGVAAGPGGLAVVSTFMDGTYTIGGGKAQRLKFPGSSEQQTTMVIDAQGTLFTASDKGIAVVPTIDKPGKPKAYSRKSGHLKSDKVLAVAPGSNGRVWAATSYALVVIDATGKATSWPWGQIEGLKQAPVAIALAAGGPELPPLGELKTFKLTGKVMLAGKPLPNATLEFCADPENMFRRSPCGDAPDKVSVVTGADGAFTVEKMPLGAYQPSVKRERGWAVFQRACCAEAKSGETVDLGAIELKE